MISNDTINQLLGIEESYKAPEKMLEIMLDDVKRVNLFERFLEHETDLGIEWFQNYFESEHADRKVKKQDFTPNAVSKLGARIIGESSQYFEAAAGTGGMVIQAWVFQKNRFYIAEELSDRAIPFLIFNMAIRGIEGKVLHGDSLNQVFKQEYTIKNSGKFSTVVPSISLGTPVSNGTSVMMNPPFSAKWEQKNDERFELFGLAPKTKADFAFLLHGFHQLQDGGTMAIVLPHGVLFRGAAEGKIRQKLLEINAIYAIIGLPSKIFAGTDIPTTLIVLKKNRLNNDVFFIDASKEFEKSKSNNVMHKEHINKILKTYQDRIDIDKFAHLASFEEIVENDYNLNIPRFVDTFEEEAPIDLGKTATEIMGINQQIRESEAGLLTMLDQLTGNPNVMADIELMKMMLTDDIGGSPSGQARLF